MSTSTAEITSENEPTPVAPKAAKPKRESFIHKLYTSDFNIDFIGKRRVWYLISGTLIVICLVSLIFRGLNLGIEFKGGTVFQVPVSSLSSQTISDYQKVVADSKVPGLDGATVTTQSDNTVRVQVPSLSTENTAEFRGELAAKAGIASDDVTYQAIGPSWGSQITTKGVQALVVFLVLVALMIGIYFRNWKMSLAALVALAHDLIITIGVYSIVGFTVTPATITGVLTILGYSLYDTVVVFDKVRENTTDVLKRNVTYSYEANIAVNQVFVRSINTTITGVLPVVAMLVAGIVFLGGQGPLPDLGLAMAVGMVAGAWSSIFIATPILDQLKEREPEQRAHREALAKHQKRTKAKVTVAVAETNDQLTPTAPTGLSVTTVPIPAATVELEEPAPAPDESPSAGRPQPRHTSRSQRKKGK
jgi:preprotein translocase subunit SecF